ncbi:MAG: dephospho-CoA kinase [Flavipsychrobacter sp.]|jgi:dephospho-CoA kinase|nr:dephospho-CoA kinase [Flavipsychrobacter sp.]
MLKVGVTGGIGSGKSVVCQVFQTLGIPVFNADETARYLMENDTTLVQRIQLLLGDDVYKDGKLDKSRVSTIIYEQPGMLEKLNEIVHPATISYANAWMEKQISPYVVKEAAIFFESGSNKDIDVMIGVSAPKELRISRAMDRNQISREKVLSIMSRQMDEDEKMKRCDHVITNDDLTPLLPQVLKLHELLISRTR